MIRLWHRYILRHTVTHHPAIRPDEVIRDGKGKPMINVYKQTTFQRPDEYYTCSCGRTLS